MAQGRGIPKMTPGQYGYGTKPASNTPGKSPKRGYNSGSNKATQIIETQRPEHQTIKVGKTSK